MSNRDLEGRFIVITGANTGIGRVTAETLAARGANVLLACRSEERTTPVVEAIRAAGGKAQFMELDLGELASVRTCATKILDLDLPIDILINNAGLAGKRGLTKDGFEITFGTNHLGHFLFTVLLAPRLRTAKNARVVTVSSKAHYEAKTGIDYSILRNSTASISGLPEYGVSKLANIFFTKELARRLEGVHTYALHPGVVASDVWRQVPWGVRSFMKLFMLSNEDGAKTNLYCATSPAVASENGLYYDSCKEKTPSSIARDPAKARELWEKSVEYVDADL
ncbi:MAG: SDR family oxidoreductase [Polyangiaceae bacterium]